MPLIYHNYIIFIAEFGECLRFLERLSRLSTKG